MNNSTNIGELKTFRQLIEEENTIIIPKVQRDYAYGRENKKVAEILNGMLTKILEAARDNKSNILDFVYGGSYVQKKDISAGFIPLDGQQRLTTLFLLFFYASLLGDENQNPIDKSEVEFLKKFRYETRQSATEFCTNLIGSIRDNLIRNQYKPDGRNLKELIKDDALFLSTYDSDPTILSMLNVLDKIESKCIEMNVLKLSPCLWYCLYNKDNNKFYKLTLDKFGLTDDLYIKMNARGKKLTEFDIFKSDMIAAVDAIDSSLKDVFSTKIDSKWIDIVWDHTIKTISSDRTALDITTDADKMYAMLFQNLFNLEFYRRDLSNSGCKEPTIENILGDKNGVNEIISLLDFLYDLHKNGGFDDYWNSYFYFEDKVVGNDERIRLFWKNTNKWKSVFELALYGELTVPERVYFYACYLLHKKGCTLDESRRCLRIIRNLMTANVRAKDIKNEDLPGFLQETEYIVDHKGVDVYYDPKKTIKINGKSHNLSFIQIFWNEEFYKQNFLSPTDYQKLLRYENHDILRCSLFLFMEYCLPSTALVGDTKPLHSLDATKLLEMLDKFERLFNNDYKEFFHEIRTLFLDPQTEYMQYEPKMTRSNDMRRYFITEPGKLNDFFIKNINRQDQNNIIKILDDMTIPANLQDAKTICHKFNCQNWKYYLAKYPKQSNKENTTGIGIWEDVKSHPLDLIWLNRSYHGEAYLEWMMMTYLLWRVMNDTNKYKLDDHGCKPILITSNATQIGFKKGKWEIKNTKDLPLKYDFPGNGIDLVDKGDETYTADLSATNTTMDYIDLGKLLISIIEK